MQGVTILVIYFLVMMGVTLFISKNKVNKEQFLVGNRSMGTIQSAMSIAATWIWAPALFVSAEKAYINGVVGLFWFLVPNILCLLIFIPHALKIREQLPKGYTLAGYMENKYSKGVGKVYTFQLVALTFLSTAVQLLAGGKILSSVAGLPFGTTTIILGIIALSYSFIGGIKASIITDSIQMIFILIACFIFVPWVLNVEGIETLKLGLGGVSGQYTNLFDENGINVFINFGLASAIGLIAGPFGDQTFWQRTFSIKESKIKKSFLLGTFIFALVPLSMSVLGFVSAGKNYVAVDSGIVNLELITNILPSWTVYPFIFMLISGLLSTIDSNLCAISSLVFDNTKDNKNVNSIELGKISMIVLMISGVFIANIQGLTITHLFLLYGTLRSSTLITTVMTLNGVKLHPKGVLMGIIIALLVGLPIFTYGSINGLNTVKLVGSLLTVSLSGIFAYFYTKVGVRNAN